MTQPKSKLSPLEEIAGEQLEGASFENETSEPDFVDQAADVEGPLDPKAGAILEEWRNAPNFKPFVHIRDR